MAINRPYRRTCRQFLDGTYSSNGRWGYIIHPKFAQSPSHYIRGFMLLLKDLQELFDYVEPADDNLSCYSYRIHALLLRACVEVEANCKAVLKENGYVKTDKKGNDVDMNMSDYKKINVSHHLSSYQVQVPHWTGNQSLRTPFSAWAAGETLPWYNAYNATKHDRLFEFRAATFEHLLDACCGVLVMLSAQFWNRDFAPFDVLVSSNGVDDGLEDGIGGYFRVKFPDDFSEELRYDFDWKELQKESDPFQTFDYSKSA
jgi:hypothetical protein